MAELLDNAHDASATKLLIDTLPGGAASQHRLVLVNNAAGMSRDEVHDCLSFGYSHKSEQDVGMFGLGFQHGTMGVGDSATLGSVRVCEDDEALLEVNVGLLSLKLMDELKAPDLVLPMLTWRQQGANRVNGVNGGWALVTAVDEAELEMSKQLMELFTPYGSVDELRDAVLAQVARVGRCGTVVEIFDLHPGQLSFDPRAPDGDIRLLPGNKTHTNAATEAESLPLDYSLRAYLEVLYLPHPHKPFMDIELCGAPVAPRKLEDELYKPLSYTFDPDRNAAQRVRMTFGLDLADKAAAPSRRGPPRLSAQSGVAVYFRWRLIQARTPVGRDGHPGVLGVCQLVHCTPEATKQGFLHSPALTNLKARLGDNQHRYVMSCHNGEHNDFEPLIPVIDVLAAMQAAVDDQVARIAEEKALQDAVDNDGRPSVYCDECGKYRFISEALFNSLAGGEVHWVCADNVDDPQHASCEAPVETPRPCEGRERLPEQEAPHPDWLPAGWRAVNVPSGNEGRLVSYFYPPNDARRLRSQREVQRFLAAQAPKEKQPPRSKRPRGEAAKTGGGGGGGGGGGERATRTKTDRGLLAANAALERKKREQEAEAARISAERRELQRKERELQRKQVALLSAQKRNRRQSSRVAQAAQADAADAVPAPVLRRVCLCQALEDDESGLLTQCATDGCGKFFHASCLGLTQAHVERHALECVDHAPAAVAARQRRDPSLPGAGTPSVSRVNSAASGLARLGGDAAGPEAESQRRLPVNWPDAGVKFITRNAFAPPGSDEERLRRKLERRAPNPGVEIIILTRKHRAWRHKRWTTAGGDDGPRQGTVAPRGVVATKPFQPGDVIGMYNGHVRAKMDRDNTSDYVMLLPNGFVALEALREGGDYDAVVIDAAVCGNEMRFINSAAGMGVDPNCEFAPTTLAVSDTCEELAVAVLATRAIKAGDELLANYGESYPLD